MPIVRSSSPAVRVRVRSLCAWELVLALVAAAVFAVPASAQTSILSGHAGTTFVPTISQGYTNVSTATLTGLVAHDASGNDGVAGGSLSTTTGNFVLWTHACSGGGPGFGGQATGSAYASITLDYKIVSATLPPGTPVQVSVRWAMRSRVTAIGQDMVGSNTNVNAAAGGRVAIYPNYAVAVNKPGSYSRSTSASGDQVVRTGALNTEADSDAYVYTLPVGQVVRLFIEGQIGANSSVEAGTTDGDVQFSTVWGVSSLNSDAAAVLNSNPNEPAPAAEMATPAHAEELLPPRDINLLPCFVFQAQPVDVDACGATDATFTVQAQGAGPFFYRWRKNGVPIDNDVYPSATTATLVLSNVSPADAGSYDVVVTNNCGDIVSAVATLVVCPAAAVPDRPALTFRSFPNPFNPSTEVSFSMPESGPVDLAVFDLRGACVKVLQRGLLEAGVHAVTWDGRNAKGSALASGIYLVRLKTADGTRTLRVTMLE